nr:MAG TPA: hypothetical protein [Bacteriophage sp.]
MGAEARVDTLLLQTAKLHTFLQSLASLLTTLTL